MLSIFFLILLLHFLRSETLRMMLLTVLYVKGSGNKPFNLKILLHFQVQQKIYQIDSLNSVNILAEYLVHADDIFWIIILQ